ncbi:hypothetical protein PRZ48_006765 [Zasmidium cellare]|uniref:Uncharacterized protein n=1 Tax=Zasmidium cellare TaxID=395010 RepID=A0ABR0EHH0_ZASCE|nr:hypothetical protein PRZ48_006765 [Zasmidium cellare]
MDLAWAELEAEPIGLPFRFKEEVGLLLSGFLTTSTAWMVHMDHYYPNATEERKQRLIHHGQHCVDALRRNLLCYADPTLITLNWERTITGRPGIQADETQRCVNWDSLHNWMLENGAKAADMIRPDGTLFDESSLVES